jgi:hypothetical protein
MKSRLMPIAVLLAVPVILHPVRSQGSKKDGKPPKVKYQSVTGSMKSLDLIKGVLVVKQKLKKGYRDVRFKTTGSTKVFWSKTTMPVTLKDLRPGIRLIVQYYKKGKHLVAVKVVLPGGMKEAAKAILNGDIKGGGKK